MFGNCSKFALSSQKTGTVRPVFVCDWLWHISYLIHLSKSNECFWKTWPQQLSPSHVPFSFPLWDLSQQFMETDESVGGDCARITIVSGWYSILNPPAFLNSVCLSLALWEGVGFALRPHLLSQEPQRRRPTGSKPLLQVPSPGLYQSRLELVSPHN